MIKVVITGPESTGKTTLAQSVGEHYHLSWVAEYARIFLNQLNRPYEQADLLSIAKGQLASEKAAETKEQKLILCDTSLEVIKIWSEVKYQDCHPWILDSYAQQQVDLYLLCAPDIPWQPDPQREHPQERERLFAIYQRELAGTRHAEIRGSHEQRLATAIQAIGALGI